MLKVIELLNKLDKNVYYFIFNNVIYVDIYYENGELMTKTKEELRYLLNYLKKNAESVDNFYPINLYYFYNFKVIIKNIEVKE